MQEITIYDYYAFGHDYRMLTEDHSNVTNKVMEENINLYISFIDKLNLVVTKSAISHVGLDAEIEKLQKLSQNIKTKNLIIDAAFLKSIIEKIQKIDVVLDSELKIKTGYSLDEKRFSNEILINSITKLFGENVFPRLPHIAQFDFQEAGRCLAFDRFTAVAFHALRGTEDVLKYYYEILLNLKTKEADTWGTFEKKIIDSISKKTITPEPPEELIINLTSLRKYYRNKTQHPQLTFSGDECQDLLSLCIKTVNELIKDLERRKLI